ncbi:MAG: hypothetical protein ABIU87_14230 [Ornithinibacter sp.]
MAHDDITLEDTAHEIEHRVHTDLGRVRPQDMLTSQEVTPPQDPRGGRDTDRDFMLRNAGW